MNLITIPLTERTVPRPLWMFLLALLILNALFVVKKKKVINEYPFFLMLISFIGICVALVQTLKHFSDQSGYPAGRALVLIYPVCILALEELLTNCVRLFEDIKIFEVLNLTKATVFNFLSKYSKKVRPSMVVRAASVAVSIIALIFCMSTTNYKQSTDWPEAAMCKKAAYEVYKSKGEKGMGYLEDISYNTDAFIYWQQKILYEDGYDIFEPNS